MKVVMNMDRKELLKQRKAKRNRELVFLAVLLVLMVEIIGVLVFATHKTQTPVAIKEEQTTHKKNQTHSVTPKHKQVALTFDDGPNEGTTDKLLDILKEKQVKASFFVVGVNAEKEPKLLQRMEKEGHLIGSHTYYHRNLTQTSAETIQKDRDKMNELLRDTIGMTPVYLRPPYGAINPASNQVIKQPSVQWSVDSRDWVSRNPKSIVTQVQQTVFDGSIVLMHDTYPETIEAVPNLIYVLEKEGYEFVTVSELLQGATAPINYFSQHDRKIIR